MDAMLEITWQHRMGEERKRLPPTAGTQEGRRATTISMHQLSGKLTW